jgi:hypothetical protein
MRDLGNNLVSVQSLASAVTAGNNATVNATAVDLKGFEGAYVNVNTGVEGVALSNNLKIEFKLMHGDATNALVAVEQKDVTDSSVTSGVFLTLDDNAETPQTSSIGYIGGKRYVSVDVVFTGNHTTGTPMSIDVIKGYARHSEGASTVTVA